MNINEEDDYVHYNLGMLLKNQNNDIEQATYHFKRVLEINPACHCTHYNLAFIYNDENEYDHSLHHFSKSLELHPKEQNIKTCLFDLVEKRFSDSEEWVQAKKVVEQFDEEMEVKNLETFTEESLHKFDALNEKWSNLPPCLRVYLSYHHKLDAEKLTKAFYERREEVESVLQSQLRTLPYDIIGLCVQFVVKTSKQEPVSVEKAVEEDSES